MIDMYARLCSNRLQHLARQFPAVLIFGARQVGKTTLARTTFSNYRYQDPEDPGTRGLFAEDPRFQLDARSAGGGLILDEAQRLPVLFDALRGAIDADRQHVGRFILLGSAQPALVRQVSESLAGRIGILELSPLTVHETTTGDTPITDYRENWLAGGFPDALGATRRGGHFRDWWEGYLRTYVERDLPVMGIGADPVLVRRLLTMLAHAQGSRDLPAQRPPLLAHVGRRRGRSAAGASGRIACDRDKELAREFTLPRARFARHHGRYHCRQRDHHRPGPGA